MMEDPNPINCEASQSPINDLSLWMELKYHRVDRGMSANLLDKQVRHGMVMPSMLIVQVYE